MSEENNKITAQNENVSNTEAANEDVPNVQAETEFSTPEAGTKDKRQSDDDVSNVKIRKVLKQRFKKSNFGAKSAVALILVAIIFFMAGAFADRLVLRHRGFNSFMGRPGIMKRMPNNGFNGNQFRNGKVPNKGAKNNKIPGNTAPNNNTPGNNAPSNNNSGSKTQ